MSKLEAEALHPLEAEDLQNNPRQKHLLESQDHYFIGPFPNLYPDSTSRGGTVLNRDFWEAIAANKFEHTYGLEKLAKTAHEPQTDTKEIQSKKNFLNLLQP